MSSFAREALIEAAANARRRKRRVSYIDRKLTWATVEQIKNEMAEEARSFWPTPIVAAALFIGIGCLFLSMIGV
jgi:hypothetical protein